MAIQMQGTAINSEKRNSFKNMEVQTFENPFPISDGQSVVGITATFAEHVKSDIEALKTNISTKLSEIQNTQNDAALKGELLPQGISNFIDAVVETANSFNKALSDAEQDIISSVDTAYTTQDANLTGDLSRDASTLTSQVASSGSC